MITDVPRQIFVLFVWSSCLLIGELWRNTTSSSLEIQKYIIFLMGSNEQFRNYVKTLDSYSRNWLLDPVIHDEKEQICMLIFFKYVWLA